MLGEKSDEWFGDTVLECGLDSASNFCAMSAATGIKRTCLYSTSDASISLCCSSLSTRSLS